ncbi:MAG: DOMON domain-containing protein [Desulfobacterium sp.]|nr:DOMON domain-containing protein [Desulfobacterium sp.]
MNKILVYMTLAFTIFLNTGECIGGTASFDHKIEVDKMSFEWKLDDKVIHIRLAAETTGWVGIGFNPSKEMKDANFIIGYVKNGKAKVMDHTGTSNRQHDADKKAGGKDNVTDITGSEQKEVTEIGFTIPLNSGDTEDQVIDPDAETTVLLACGSGRDSFRTKHEFNTVLKVFLKTGKFTKIK